MSAGHIELLTRRVERLERAVGLGKLNISHGAASELIIGDDGSAKDARAQLMAVRDFLRGLYISGQLSDDVREKVGKVISDITV